MKSVNTNFLHYCFASVYHRKCPVATSFQGFFPNFPCEILYNLESFPLLIQPILCKKPKLGRRSLQCCRFWSWFCPRLLLPQSWTLSMMTSPTLSGFCNPPVVGADLVSALAVSMRGWKNRRTQGSPLQRTLTTLY